VTAPTTDLETPMTLSLLEPVADEDIPTLEMVQPLVGFPERRRFALARLDELGVICDLRSLDDPDLRFVVMPPTPFCEDYAPEIDESVADQLGAADASDLIALVVVTLGDSPADATANLLAPVLVNHRTRRAGQFVLDDAALPLRAPLLAHA